MALNSPAGNASAEQLNAQRSVSPDDGEDTIAPSRGHGVRAISNMVQLDVSAAAAQPVWPSPSPGFLKEWEEFARYPNYLAAMIVAGLLESEGVPAIVNSFIPFPGVYSSAIWVPKELVHRARWILSWPPPTDAELTFLATGELLTDNQQP